MKFKISDRFWSDIKDYLDSNTINYRWNQQPEAEFGLLTIESNEKQITNQEQLIAQKLLSQFHKQKISKTNLTVSQWMKSYARRLYQLISDDEQIKCNSLNHDLLIAKYNQLKNKIVNKKKILAQEVGKNLQEKQKYSLSSEIEDKKIKAGIDNISYRIKLVSQKQQQQDQELARVKNVIKNGMWGMLSQVDQKLHKIQVLQNQIQELKKK